MKKFGCIILLLAMMMSLIPTFSYAKEAENTDSLELLIDLGILSGYSADSYKSDSYPTTGAYLNAVMNLLQNDVTFGITNDDKAVTMAQNLGIVEEGRLALAKPISVEDAIEILVKGIGYYGLTETGKSLAEVANMAGLTKGVSTDMTANAKLVDMITLLCNALDAPTVNISLIVGKFEYEIDNDKTVMNAYKDIYKVRGIVKGNSYTTLTGDPKKWGNYIQIDNMEILIDDMSANDFLGYNVEAYVHYDKDDEEYNLKHIREHKNNVMELDKTDILDVDDEVKNIEYDKGDNKKDTVVLTPSVKVILNGNAYTSYTKNDFLLGEGKVKLIDNNNDKKYDVVLISSFETFVVESVSARDGVISNQYTYSGAQRTVDLDIDNENRDHVIYRNGVEIDLSEIKSDDVLLVAEPKTGTRQKVVIYASNSVADVVVTSVDGTENKVYTDTAEYELSRDYIDAGTTDAETGKVPDPKYRSVNVGESYKLYLDAFGRIAFVKYGDKNVQSYGYITRLYYDEYDSGRYIATLFGIDGNWHTFTLAENVLYGTTKTDKLVFNTLTTGGSLTKAQMIKYKTNAKSEIKKIETATVKDEYDDKLFTQTNIIENEEFRKETYSFVGSCIYLNEDAVVMVIPSDITDKENFSIKSRAYFGNDEYICSVYDIDEWRTSSFASVTYDESRISTADANLFVVTKVRKMLDMDDVMCDEIYGYEYPYGFSSLLSKDNTVLASVAKGDVLQVATDTNSKVIKINKVHDFNDYGAYQWTNSYNFHEATTVVKGFVKGINQESGLLSVECESGKAPKVLKLYPNGDAYYPFTATIYDRTTGEVINGDTNDIRTGDYVVIDVSWYKVTNVVVYR